MRRRPAVLIVAGFGVFVFLGLSFLLARGLTGSSAERGKVLDVLEAQASGDAAAVLAQLPACRAEPACAQLTRAARARARTARRGADPQLRAEYAALAHAPHRHRPRRLERGEGLPIVQCVRVRREGPLTGAGVQLLSLSHPIGLESSC